MTSRLWNGILSSWRRRWLWVKEWVSDRVKRQRNCLKIRRPVTRIEFKWPAMVYRRPCGISVSAPVARSEWVSEQREIKLTGGQLWHCDSLPSSSPSIVVWHLSERVASQSSRVKEAARGAAVKSGQFINQVRTRTSRAIVLSISCPGFGKWYYCRRCCFVVLWRWKRAHSSLCLSLSLSDSLPLAAQPPGHSSVEMRNCSLCTIYIHI